MTAAIAATMTRLQSEKQDLQRRLAKVETAIEALEQLDVPRDDIPTAAELQAEMIGTVKPSEIAVHVLELHFQQKRVDLMGRANKGSGRYRYEAVEIAKELGQSVESICICFQMSRKAYDLEQERHSVSKEPFPRENYRETVREYWGKIHGDGE